METILVHPGETIDANNDRIPATAPEFEVHGCAIEFLDSEEAFVRGRSGMFSKIRIFITEPLTEPVTHSDDVTVRGKRYMVSGEPFDWVDPFDDIDGSDPVGNVLIGYRAEG